VPKFDRNCAKLGAEYLSCFSVLKCDEIQWKHAVQAVAI